jgi:cell division protein FtsB
VLCGIRDRLYCWRRKLATVAVCGVALWIASHAIFGSNGWVVYQKKKAEHRAVQKEIESLQREHDELQQRIKGLKTDPNVIEREAREQLRYARPGETVYVMPGRPLQQAPPADANAKK